MKKIIIMVIALAIALAIVCFRYNEKQSLPNGEVEKAATQLEPQFPDAVL